MESTKTSLGSSGPQGPRFLDQVRQAALAHYNRNDAAERCVDWSRRFILFHNKRHPSEMGRSEIGAFLQHVAGSAEAARVVDELHNAREALSFVYERLLGRQFGDIALPEPPRLLDRLRQALRVGAALFAAHGRMLCRMGEPVYSLSRSASSTGNERA